MPRFKFATRSSFLLLLAAGIPCLAGEVYVIDGTSVYTFNPQGQVTTFATQPGASVLQMAFNAGGYLFGAARDSSSIIEISPTGTENTFATVSDPEGLAVNAAGDVYTGSNYGSTLLEYGPGGGTPTTVATNLQIESLATDAAGNVYALTGANQIVIFSPSGAQIGDLTGVPGTFGIALDSAGHVFVGDWNNFTIQEYIGGVWQTFGALPTNQLPTGLAFDSSGNLFVSEVANGESFCCTQSVYEFSPSGVRTTAATGLYIPYAVAIQPAEMGAAPEPSTFFLLTTALFGACLLRARTRLRQHR